MKIPVAILFVEDVEEDAVLMARELQRGGFAPTWKRVQNREGLQAALTERKWDLVISDFSMPSFNALDALRLVKIFDDQLPFIIVSGVMDEETAVAAINSGAQNFFLKSSIGRLPGAVERELREDAARRKQRANTVALRDMQARFDAFMVAAPTPAWIKDKDFRYVYVNTAQARFFDLSVEELIGRTDFDLSPAGVAQSIRTADEKVVRDKCELRHQETMLDGDHRFHVFDIVRFPLSVDLPHGQGMVAGVAVDVTEREQKRAELEQAFASQKALSSLVIDLQERERRYLADSLHEELGQSLGVLKMKLESIQKAGAAGGATGQAAALQGAIDISAGILAQVRALSDELRPPQLDNLGMVPAMRAYLEDKTREAGLACQFDAAAFSLAPHPDIEIAAFRILQEAVKNVLRHAGATSLAVSIKPIDHHLSLSISDDGQGFETDAARAQARAGTTFGILNMEQRAMLVGGSVTITSRSGHGATINVLLPLVPSMQRDMTS